MGPRWGDLKAALGPGHPVCWGPGLRCWRIGGAAVLRRIGSEGVRGQKGGGQEDGQGCSGGSASHPHRSARGRGIWPQGPGPLPPASETSALRVWLDVVADPWPSHNTDPHCSATGTFRSLQPWECLEEEYGRLSVKCQGLGVGDRTALQTFYAVLYVRLDCAYAWFCMLLCYFCDPMICRTFRLSRPQAVRSPQLQSFCRGLGNGEGGLCPHRTRGYRRMLGNLDLGQTMVMDCCFRNLRGHGFCSARVGLVDWQQDWRRDWRRNWRRDWRRDWQRGWQRDWRRDWRQDWANGVCLAGVPGAGT